MRKFFILVGFCIFFHTAVNCQSMHEEIPTSRLSLGLETALPIGNINLSNSFGVGLSMKTVTPFASFAGITLSGGALHYFGKKNFGNKSTTAFFCFPLKAGISFFTRKGIYIEPQAGYSIASSKIGSEGSFCYAANAGCLVNNYFDISFHYESMANNLSFSQIGLRLAYRF